MCVETKAEITQTEVKTHHFISFTGGAVNVWDVGGVSYLKQLHKHVESKTRRVCQTCQMIKSSFDVVHHSRSVMFEHREEEDASQQASVDDCSSTSASINMNNHKSSAAFKA